MADGFKLTYNPKVENARLVREGIKGTGPGTKIAQGGKASTRPSVNGGWNPLKWLKGKTQAPVKTAPVKTKPPVSGKPIGPGGIEGSIAGAAVYAAGDALIPHISREAVRGALVVTGQDTTDFDNLNTGRPVVRNVGGKSFNIATPEGLRGYQKALASDEKPSAPAKPADSPKTYTVSGVTYDTATGRPVNAPEGGYSVTPDGGMVPHSSSESGSQRTNPNGLVSYGKDLSSLNQFTREFTGGYEVADIQSAFQSEDLPTAYQTGSNTISTEQTSYELPEGAAPSPLNQGLAGTSDLKISDSGYTIGEASVPGTVGRTGDAQEGSSAKPDIAEEVRTIRMRRKGPRDDGGPRGFNIDRQNEMAQNSVSETKGNGMNARRRAIRGTFLNHEGNTIQAITAARAVAGVGNDSNGDDVYNVDGKLVYAKDGQKYKAIDELMMGRDPREFLDIPEAPAAEQTETTPDLSKVDVKSDTFTQARKEAQEFLKGKLTKTK